MAEDKGPAPVPYIVHEAELARMERCNRRMIWLCIILAAALVGSNALHWML